MPHLSGPFLKIEPTLTYNPPKSVVYVMVLSWGCVVYGFGQMYNGVCP